MAPSIVHPTKKDEQLFLFFDFTHNFKNIYNQFENKQRMNPPTVGHEDVLGKSCNADFAHIKHLYAMEEDKALKIAHTLKKVALNPSSIARTSPQHALGKFIVPIDKELRISCLHTTLTYVSLDFTEIVSVLSFTS